MARAKPIPGLDVDDTILASAFLIIETRLGEMLAYEPFMHDAERMTELHQMRIASKRLRYTMEIFQPVYDRFTPHGKKFGQATDKIKDLQEHLGEIHDADVLVPRLEEHLGRLLKEGYGRNKRREEILGVDRVDLDGCQGLVSLCQTVRNERRERFARLLADWAELRKANFFPNLVTLIKQSAEIRPRPQPVSQLQEARL